MEQKNNSIVLAVVGMPGSGKSAATRYLHTKGIPVVRFGDITDDGLAEKNLPLTPENEKTFREAIREELGMDAYAQKAKPKIEKLLETNRAIALDGLYSWEEYVYLKKLFPQLVVVHMYAEPRVRYKRLVARKVRPLTSEEARARDIAEIEKLHKGGPIAIADYIIENETDMVDLTGKIDTLLQRLQITV